MKKIFPILLVLILSFSVCGCSLVPSVELTKREQKVIAEYAAGLLLKYDRNYGGALLDLEEESGTDIGVVVNEEAKIPTADETDDNEDTNAVDPEFSEDLTADGSQSADASDIQYSDMTIAESLGLDGFDVIYKSNEVHNIYPEEESDELVFSLQAQNGMELLVLNFTITNNSADRRMCDILDSDASFRLLINGSERVNANKTILLNDLSSYSDEIEGYGMVDACLVFEVSEGTSSTINSMDLIIKKDDSSTTHSLK